MQNHCKNELLNTKTFFLLSLKEMHDFVTQSSCHSNCALAFKEVTALLGRSTVVIQKPAVLYGNSAETHTASCSLPV